MCLTDGRLQEVPFKETLFLEWTHPQSDRELLLCVWEDAPWSRPMLVGYSVITIQHDQCITEPTSGLVKRYDIHTTTPSSSSSSSPPLGIAAVSITHDHTPHTPLPISTLTNHHHHTPHHHHPPISPNLRLSAHPLHPHPLSVSPAFY
eukprot:GHVQ01001434.1.p1 GENE.GHVQ01001434.1~~GHVQ01001434.1.p1  ORF type:complete len:148 (+),score=30.92 GHVQ01001434.1:275-718(+)